MTIPWSKRHKREFQGKTFSLSNSFAQPLTQLELEAYYRRAVGETAAAVLLDEYRTHSLEYTPNGGSEDVKQAIADLYNNDNDNNNQATLGVQQVVGRITPDDVLVCPGGQVAIQMAAQAMAFGGEPKLHAICFTPGYQSVVESATWFGGNNTTVTYIPRRPANDWKIDIDAVRDAIIPGQTRYMVLNEPYNPAGTVMDRTTQQALIDLARQNDIVILCDEVYRLLEHDAKADRLPAMAQAYERGMSVVTLSKPWGACGVTVGWIVTQDAALREALWNVQYFGTACPSRASELQAVMVLRSSVDILRDRLAIIRHNKALLQDVIERRYPHFLAWTRPTAGAIGFVQFKGPLTSAELGALLAQRGISIKPAYCFMANNDDDDDDDDLASYFRVGFGERCMPQALEAFCAVLDEYQDEWRAIMQSS